MRHVRHGMVLKGHRGGVWLEEEWESVGLEAHIPILVRLERRGLETRTLRRETPEPSLRLPRGLMAPE